MEDLLLLLNLSKKILENDINIGQEMTELKNKISSGILTESFQNTFDSLQESMIQKGIDNLSFLEYYRDNIESYGVFNSSYIISFIELYRLGFQDSNKIYETIIKEVNFNSEEILFKYNSYLSNLAVASGDLKNINAIIEKLGQGAS